MLHVWTDRSLAALELGRNLELDSCRIRFSVGGLHWFHFQAGGRNHRPQT